MALASVIMGFCNGLKLVDFQWLPVKILMNGENPYLYSLNHIPFMNCRVEANQVPSCLVLLAPFALFSRWMANAVWDVCNLIFTAAFFFSVWKLWFENKLGGRAFAFVTLVTFMGCPWRALISNGQHLMFSLAFFTAALLAIEKGWKFWAGVLLALAMFKYTTTAPLCFIFLCRKEWRTIFVCATIHMLLTIGVGIFIGEDPTMLVVQSLKVGGALTAAGNADIASLVHAFGCEDVKTWANVGYVFYGMLCFFVAFAGKKDLLLKLAALATISNVMFYHRVYDFVTLVFPLVFVIRDWNNREVWSWFVRALTFINVIWTFFAAKLLADLHVGYNVVAITFSLEHLLLGSLLVVLFTTSGDNGIRRDPGVPVAR